MGKVRGRPTRYDFRMDKRRDEIREEITDADATGLVANEEFIAQTETLLPLLHGALPQGHEAHSTIDDLHKEVKDGAPDRPSIENHVAKLRSIPELEAIIANWWDNPQTQRFVWSLSQGGL
jgi:hypothetical protein